MARLGTALPNFQGYLSFTLVLLMFGKTNKIAIYRKCLLKLRSLFPQKYKNLLSSLFSVNIINFYLFLGFYPVELQPRKARTRELSHNQKIKNLYILKKKHHAVKSYLHHCLVNIMNIVCSLI